MMRQSLSSKKGDEANQLNFYEEHALDPGAQGSVLEWLQGTFKDV